MTSSTGKSVCLKVADGIPSKLEYLPKLPGTGVIYGNASCVQLFDSVIIDENHNPLVSEMSCPLLLSADYDSLSYDNLDVVSSTVEGCYHLFVWHCQPKYLTLKMSSL